MRAKERVILVKIITPKNRWDAERSLEELEQLVHSAGGIPVDVVTQRRASLDPAYLMGEGKARELRALAENIGVRTIVLDNELSPTQQRNLENLIEAKIIDRTRLILDVFAQRARTREGILQVEMAQSTYLLTRLIGPGAAFGQQLGGIGSRGPGERALEYDRRRLRERVEVIKRRLASVAQERAIQRDRRVSQGLAQIAIIGYTNVGKSSLINRLTGSDINGQMPVYADDRLFATLDPTTRRIYLPGGLPVLLTDTVGFIAHLPAHLAAGFRATFEEINQAHLLLVIHDPTVEAIEWDRRSKTIDETLQEIGAGERPRLNAISKSDLLSAAKLRSLRQSYPGYPLFSSMSDDGLKNLIERIERRVLEPWPKAEIRLSPKDGQLVSELYATGKVHKFSADRYGGYRIIWQAPADQIARIEGLTKANTNT